MLSTIAPCGVRTFLRGMPFDMSLGAVLPALKHRPKRPAIIKPATDLTYTLRRGGALDNPASRFHD